MQCTSIGMTSTVAALECGEAIPIDLCKMCSLCGILYTIQSLMPMHHFEDDGMTKRYVCEHSATHGGGRLQRRAMAPASVHATATTTAATADFAAATHACVCATTGGHEQCKSNVHANTDAAACTRLAHKLQSCWELELAHRWHRQLRQTRLPAIGAAHHPSRYVATSTTKLYNDCYDQAMLWDLMT